MDNFNLSLVVLISGLLVVFLVLILLTALIWCYGKIVSSVGGKGGSKQSKKEDAPKSAAAPKASAAVKKAAPKAASGIPGEIIAVIAAAVASLEGGSKYVIRGIKRSKPSRSAWGTAGVMDNTRPF